MRTHGLRERSITHWGKLWGGRGETVEVGEVGKAGGNSMGRNAGYSIHLK